MRYIISLDIPTVKFPETQFKTDSRHVIVFLMYYQRDQEKEDAKRRAAEAEARYDSIKQWSCKFARRVFNEN